MTTFFEEVKDAILDNLEDMVEYESYGSDFAVEMFDDRVADYFDFDESEAQYFIKEHFDDAGEYLEYENIMFGKIYTNPFKNPLDAANKMICEAMRTILAGAVPIDEFWNENHKFTKDDIEDIKNYVENYQWAGF